MRLRLALLMMVSSCGFPKPADVPSPDDGGSKDAAGDNAADAKSGDASGSPPADATDSGTETPGPGLDRQRVIYDNIIQLGGRATSQIFSIRLDGSGAKQLTSEAAGAAFGTVTPDGKHLLFTAYHQTGNNTDIVIENIDGTGRRLLATSGAENLYPAISTDGQLVAFTSIRNTDSNESIYVANLATGDAGSVLRISPDNGHQHRWPSWNGNANVTFTDYTINDILVTNADGTHLVNLTNNPAYDIISAFSPDGSKIAFTSQRSGAYEIWIMNADGSNPRQLTTGADAGGGVAFDLTGRYLVYFGNFNISTVAIDGTGMTKLTDAGGMGAGVYSE